MKASIGRIVIVEGKHPQVAANRTDQAPAIIVRCLSTRDTANGPVCVNLRVFPDVGADPSILTGIPLYEDRESALEHGDPSAYPVAYWPSKG